MKCYFCSGVPVANVLRRIGVVPTGDTDKDVSYIQVVPYCGGCRTRAARAVATNWKVGGVGAEAPQSNGQ